MRKLFPLFMLMCCECGVSATLSYKQISTDTFQFMLKNELALEVEQAQSLLFSAAVQICQGKAPLFGQYSFESAEPITKSDAPSSYTFFQEIRCTNQVAITTEPKTLEISKQQEERINSTVRKLTESFLTAKDNGNFKDAYDRLGPSMKALTEFDVWQLREARYLNESLGKLVQRDIWRITLYNNPKNAPDPGLYLAVDYENIYEKSPIHCGYVVWHVPTAQSESFTIVREEYGNITKEILDSLAKENLQHVRHQIGCRRL